jgi:phytoene dehydrogenase-like protein
MKTAAKKKAVIVGAGPGGTAAAMLLAHQGYDVEVFEKNARVGGRTSELTLGHYRFDLGPGCFKRQARSRDDPARAVNG